MDEIINRIIKMTEERGIKGTELGEKLGLKKSPITDWKNKKAKPTLEQIMKICEIFGISADYLLFGKTQIDKYQMLSKEDKEIVDNILKRYRDIQAELSASKIG